MANLFLELIAAKMKKESGKAKISSARHIAAIIIAEIRDTARENWLPRVYAEKVRPLRTRSNQLNIPARENKTEIFYTLLGVELKVARQRINCPDLATARFLQVFARIGCSEVAIPYDITKISVLADELESAWQRSLLLFEHEIETKNLKPQTRWRLALVKELRREIEEIGAGEAVPQFNQNTKQRIR